MKPIIFYTTNPSYENNRMYRTKITNFYLDFVDEIPNWSLPYLNNGNVYYFNTNPLIRNSELKAFWYHSNKFPEIEYITNLIDVELPILEKHAANKIHSIQNVPFDYSDLKKKINLPLFRIATHYGCQHYCSFCTGISKRITRNTMFNKQLDYIKTNTINNKWVYLDNKTYGENPEERSVVREFLTDYNLIVQTRCDTVINNIDAFKDENIKVVELGVETFNDNMLEALNKGINTIQIQEAINILNKLNKKVVLNMMFNLPGQTVEEAYYDYFKLHELLVSKSIDYFYINVYSDYKSKNIINRNENNIVRSWNKVEDISKFDKLYKMYIEEQGIYARKA